MESGNQSTTNDNWLTPGRFILFLSVLVLATYPHIILGDQTFVFRDYGVFGYPLAFYHRESFWHGEVPLWNPLNHCGVPFLAQWNTLTLYPPSIFYLLLPLTWSLPVFNLAHLILGGAGMYFLLRKWLGNDFPAALGGVAYAFNGLFLNSLAWPNNSAALGWMPWVVLTMQGAWTVGGKRLLVAAIVGALQMLTGAPEVIALTWLLVIVLWCASTFRNPRQLAGPQFLRLSSAVLLISGLCAAQLLPFFDLLLHSQRHAEYGKSDWAMPGWGLANFLVPLFFTSVVANGVRFQYDQYWTSSYYVPIAVLALALVSFLWWRKRGSLLLIVLAALSIILAMGDQGGLYYLVRKVFPGIGFMRYPIKFIILSVFLLPILGAFTLNHLEESEFPYRKKAWQWLAGTGFLFLGLALFICWFARSYPPYAPPYSNWQLTCQNAGWRIGFLTAGLMALYFVKQIKRPILARLLQAAVLVLIWLDALTHAPEQNPSVTRAIYEPGLKYLQPTPRHGASRAMLSQEAFIDLWRNTSSDTYTNFLCTRLGLNADVNLLDGIPKLDGFYSLDLRESDVVRRFFYQSKAVKPPMLQDFIGISHITAPGKNFDWLYRTNFLPMITGGQAPIFLSETAALNLITSTNFHPREEVALPSEVRSEVTVKGPSSVTITPGVVGAHRIEFDVKAAEPALVVIAQSFFHPWRATVGERPARIWKANYAFQALEVPAGASHITLRYVDWVFRAGAIISGLTVLLVIFLYAKSRSNGK